MQLRTQLPNYIALMRLNKPIGILLLLWPTLWALWLTSGGLPSPKLLFIFILGVVLTRSAGAIINDIADRQFDGQVKRTRLRPLANNKISLQAALSLALLLSLSAFTLVLFCNQLTILLSLIGALLACLYPLMKRWIALPQAVLGMAYSWGIPMAFAAVHNQVGGSGWFLYLTAMVWPLIYDTMYAMVDRDDDVKIGVKSSAILFGRRDKTIIGLLQIIFLCMLYQVGRLFHLNGIYDVSLILVGLLFLYQQWLIKDRGRDPCFAAFLNNNWVGLIIFLGILLQ